MANEYERKSKPEIEIDRTGTGFRDDETEMSESREAVAEEKASALAGQAKESGQRTAEAAREQARSIAASASQTARGVAKESQENLSVRVEHLANALREASGALDRDFESGLARLSEDAAAALEGFSRDLKDQDVGMLLQRVNGLARNRPGAFLGGSLLLGLAVGRFLHSSSPAVDYEPIEAEAAGESELPTDDTSYIPGTTVEPY